MVFFIIATILFAAWLSFGYLKRSRIEKYISFEMYAVMMIILGGIWCFTLGLWIGGYHCV